MDWSLDKGTPKLDILFCLLSFDAQIRYLPGIQIIGSTQATWSTSCSNIKFMPPHIRSIQLVKVFVKCTFQRYLTICGHIQIFLTQVNFTNLALRAAPQSKMSFVFLNENVHHFQSPAFGLGGAMGRGKYVENINFHLDHFS